MKISSLLIIKMSALSLTLFGCTFTPCDNTVETEAQSPRGEYIATKFERNCGATADFSTIVSLRDATTPFHGEEGIVFLVKGKPEVRISWENDMRLLINCKGCSSEDIFKNEIQWKDVSIIY